MFAPRRTNTDNTVIKILHSGEPRIIDAHEISELCIAHAMWVTSNGRQGSQFKLFHSILCRYDFSGQNLACARMELCDLRFTKFINATLNNIWLYSCDLALADLTKANAAQASFLSSNCEKANFSGAMLEGACFMNAKLDQCDFRNARLSRADFDQAELSNISFDGAIMNGTNLATSYYLSQSKTGRITFDTKTKFREGFLMYDMKGIQYRVVNGKCEPIDAVVGKK